MNIYSDRSPWFPKFCAALKATSSAEMIENLLQVKVEKWRGCAPRYAHHDTNSENDPKTLTDDECGRDVLLAERHYESYLGLVFEP